MSKLFMIERRLQEMERLAENNHRLGHIEDVKFDKENKRWLVKFRDGPPQQNNQGSGGDSGGSGGTSGGDAGQSSGGSGSNNFTVMSDWLPWESMSHGTIKASVPPKKGQKAQLAAPNGKMEMGSVRAFSYGQGSESPHDKEDEVYFRIEKDTSQSNSSSNSSSSSSTSSSDSGSSDSQSQQTNNEQLNFLGTKDGLKMWIGNSSITMNANGIVFKTDKHSFTMDHEKGFTQSFNDGQHTTVMNKDGLKDSIEKGKTTLELTQDHANSKSKQVQAASDDGSATVTITNDGVDTQGRSINDG